MLYGQCHMYNVHVHCHIYNVCMCMEDRVRDREIVRGGERSVRESATLFCNTLYCSVCLRINAREKRGKEARESARTHCNTLQHTALQRRARACSLFLDALCNPCNTLQHTATHCNTLQHTATHARERSTREKRRETNSEKSESARKRERERERERERKRD